MDPALLRGTPVLRPHMVGPVLHLPRFQPDRAQAEQEAAHGVCLGFAVGAGGAEGKVLRISKSLTERIAQHQQQKEAIQLDLRR